MSKSSKLSRLYNNIACMVGAGASARAAFMVATSFSGVTVPYLNMGTDPQLAAYGLQGAIIAGGIALFAAGYNHYFGSEKPDAAPTRLREAFNIGTAYLGGAITLGAEAVLSVMLYNTFAGNPPDIAQAATALAIGFAGVGIFRAGFSRFANRPLTASKPAPAA